MSLLSETGAEVAEGGQRVMNALLDLPLATARDLMALSSFSYSMVHLWLGILREQGLVDSVYLGWFAPLSMRWFLTDQALSGLGRLGSNWHEEPARCRLLDRFPSVEWFYPAAASIRDLGAFEGFNWFDNVSLDAMARYERGWIALFWSGSFQSEERIAARLSRLGPDLREMSVSPEVPWPGLLLFIVNDHWQRELVYRAARRYYLQDQVSVLCARDGSRSGAGNVRPSRGWVQQPVRLRGAGGWSWDRRLKESPWTEKRGAVVGRTLDVVAQWPGMTQDMARQGLSETLVGRSAQRSCMDLMDRGFVDRVRDRGKYRYMITTRGVDCIARRDRVHYSHCKDRIDSLSWVNKSSLRAHEDGVMSFIGHFLGVGLPAAAGWRSWEHLGGSGGISPDGLVFMERSPFGPTWAYFEYERSARGEGRIRRKLNGYGSDRRGDDWPALVVCWNERVEKVFQEVGVAGGIPMLTTTIERLAEYGPLDNEGCWSMRGKPVLIG